MIPCFFMPQLRHLLRADGNMIPSFICARYRSRAWLIVVCISRGLFSTRHCWMELKCKSAMNASLMQSCRFLTAWELHSLANSCNPWRYSSISSHSLCPRVTRTCLAKISDNSLRRFTEDSKEAYSAIWSETSEKMLLRYPIRHVHHVHYHL